MKTESHRVRVWITNPYYGPDDIERDGPAAAERLGYSNQDMAGSGWTAVGYADVTLHLEDRETLVQNKVDALRATVKSIQAVAQQQTAAIERQIQSLLALPMPSGETA